MKPLALIVEDDPAIREALADRLESLGHDQQAACSQNEARERLSRCTYSYILLDLELPVRYGRPPSIRTGKNVLAEIRADARHAKTPVIVVTAHGHDRPDLAVEVMKAGATDFVKKPFDHLEDAISDALARNGSNPGEASGRKGVRPLERRKLESGSLVYYADRIELEGVSICTPESGTIWRVLTLLRERKTDGRPKSFPGKRVAEVLGLGRGQNAVCDALSPFRRKVVQLLEAEGIEANEDSVIITGKTGYQLNAELTVEDQSDLVPPKSKDAAEPAASAEERQQWFLAQLKAKRKLRRQDFQKQFGISTATAKRDLSALVGKVEFVGTGANGHYQACR